MTSHCGLSSDPFAKQCSNRTRFRETSDWAVYLVGSAPCEGEGDGVQRREWLLQGDTATC